MEAVKRNVCRGVIFLMACLTCVVVFGGGLIAGVYAADTPYTPYKSHVGIHVTKELVGRPFQAGDAFTFKIEPKDGAPAPVDKSGNELKTVTIVPTDGAEEGQTADIEVDAEFTFNDPGKYVYYISEDQPEKPLEGITYDQTIYRLTIEIAKEIPVQTDTSGEGEAAGAVSDNEIAASPALAEDDASQAGGEAAAAAGAGEPSDSGDSADSDASTDSGAAGMETGSEDDSQVRSGGKDKLVVKSVTLEKNPSGDKDGDDWEPVHSKDFWPDEPYHFINTYTGASVPLTGTKTLEGRKYQKGDTFTFTITPENGAPAPEDDDGQSLNKVTIEPVSGDSAEIDFGTIHFEATDLGGEEEKTFTYTITEQAGSIDGMTYDTALRTVLIEVKLQDDGSVAAEVVESESSALSWTNTWDDPDDPGEPGGDPGDGPGDDPRPSDTSLTVNKEWILDDGGEAPVSVTVELLRNNSVYDKVTLDEDNGWSHTWTRLDGRFNWRVREADVPDGFTAEVSRRGTIWTITNDDIPEDPETPPEEPDEPDTPEVPDTPDEPDVPDTPDTPDEPDVPDTPDTPDEPNTPNEPTLPQTGQSWWPVWALAIAGAILMLAGILVKKRYHGKHEA